MRVGCTYVTNITLLRKWLISNFSYHFWNLFYLSARQVHSAIISVDHTERHTTAGVRPLGEWSVRRRDFFLTKHNSQNRHPCPDRIRTPKPKKWATSELLTGSLGHWNHPPPPTHHIITVINEGRREAWGGWEVVNIVGKLDRLMLTGEEKKEHIIINQKMVHSLR